MRELAVTVVGRDRPGIIADVSGLLAGLGLNLTDTTMTLLRGHFAMTLLCAGEAATEQVRATLEPLAADGALTMSVRAVEPEDGTGGAPRQYHPGPAREDVAYLFTVYGADRLGIVAELTRVLAEGGGNITDLTTRLSGDLYLLVAEVDLDAGTDLAALRDRIHESALALGVEASLRPVDVDIL